MQEKQGVRARSQYSLHDDLRTDTDACMQPVHQQYAAIQISPEGMQQATSMTPGQASVACHQTVMSESIGPTPGATQAWLIQPATDIRDTHAAACAAHLQPADAVINKTKFPAAAAAGKRAKPPSTCVIHQVQEGMHTD